MNTESSKAICCPYCGETFEMLIEPALGAQVLITDCEICCRPLRVRVADDPDAEAWTEPA